MRAGGRVLVWALASAGLAGCAHYSTSSGLPGGIRSVAIPMAENQTAEAGLAERLAERLSAAFTRDGRFQVVDEESAGAALHLRIASVEDRPFTFTAAEQTQQYRFRLFVDGALLKSGDQSRLLELKGLVGWGTYDAAAAEEGRDGAVDAALDMLIAEIVDRATASW